MAKKDNKVESVFPERRTCMKRALWLLLVAGLAIGGASCHKKDKAAKPTKTTVVKKEKVKKVKKVKAVKSGKKVRKATKKNNHVAHDVAVMPMDQKA